MKLITVIAVTILYPVRAQINVALGTALDPNLRFLPTKPDKCYGEDDVMDKMCCIFPPFYVREVARSCGAILIIEDTFNEAKVFHLRREIPISKEEFWTCILKKYDLLDASNTLNLRKFLNHLDSWVLLNKPFATVMMKAKKYCLRIYRMYMPLRPGEYIRFQNCFRHFVELDCPTIIDNEVCRKKKAFYDECREYFL